MPRIFLETNSTKVKAVTPTHLSHQLLEWQLPKPGGGVLPIEKPSLVKPAKGTYPMNNRSRTNILVEKTPAPATR